MLSFKYLAKIIAVLILIAASFFACSKNPTIGWPGEEDLDVEGFILKKNGVDIVEYNGLILYGEVIVEMDKDDIYEVEFIDENGDPLEIKSNHYSLSWTNNNSEFVLIEPHELLKKWEFHIHGIQTGQTSFEVLLMNGDPIIPEYKSPAVPVKVTH